MVVIVAADDDPDIRAGVSAILRRAGHDVTMCADGAELVDEVRKRLPAVVVTDNQMPVMTGLQARALLRQWSETADIPVVLASGSVTPTEVTDVLGDGDQLVQKPFTRRQLTEAVAAALRYAATA
ncbi:response regulator [Dactylosporangium sp. NPDC000521]|uniref:response regulator n=1 Tax=Dactylosporangium sp. NPDC000521 TaxID=3363975 RepID=UPI0036ADFD25